MNSTKSGPDKNEGGTVAPQVKCEYPSPGGGSTCEKVEGHVGPHGCDVGKGEYSEWVDDD